MYGTSGSVDDRVSHRRRCEVVRVSDAVHFSPWHPFLLRWGPSYRITVPARSQRVSLLSSRHHVAGLSIDHQLPRLFHDQ